LFGEWVLTVSCVRRSASISGLPSAASCEIPEPVVS
jgi:hypothetical protein